MRLARQDDGHQPARILEGDQPTGPGSVSCEPFHQLKERLVFESNGKRKPFRLIDVAREDLGPSEVVGFPGELLPKGPGPTRLVGI